MMGANEKYSFETYIKEIVIRTKDSERAIEIDREVEVDLDISYDWSHLPGYRGVPPLEFCRKLIRFSLKGEFTSDVVSALPPPKLPEEAGH